MVSHSAWRAFVVGFRLIDNLLIDALVGFCRHLEFDLPRWCHQPFLFHLSLPRLALLVVRLILRCVLPFYTPWGDRWLRILELSFLALCRPRGTASSKIFCFLEMFFRSGYGPDCFQPFPIVDIFSM